MCREVHQTESLHELINIDASVLVKIDALGQVCNDIITDLCLEMRAQEFPGLAKFLVRDQTFRGMWRERKIHKLVLYCVGDLGADLRRSFTHSQK